MTGSWAASTTIDVSYPFSGRWLVQNSPADRVPSHGTARFGSAHAIDFVPVGADGRSAPVTVRTLFWTEDPGSFPGFGRPIVAPVDGRVVSAVDAFEDHPAYRGFTSMSYALTQGRRLTEGWEGLAGNHVLISTDPGVVIALCHLRRGSVLPVRGDVVRAGERIAECGNSGNSTEPHLHVQAMSGADPMTACAVSMAFDGEVPAAGRIVMVGC
ncbi:M23 family metallopeptidase [Microbacterium karelineae]|uniref:M23 family metallopeptidase n=1 Tax=Microbacterium karelineae TaxID=2654283 RepID=UPI0012EADC8F|nr:M23 family metallopeptidase [Microbacterium karelineae]